MDQSMVFFFSLVLGGAFLHGIGNTLRAYYLRNRNVSSDVSVVATMLGASVFSFAAEIAWNGIPNVSAMFWIPFSVTAVLNILIENLNTRALKMEEASVVIPLASTMPAIPARVVQRWTEPIPESNGLMTESLGKQSQCIRIMTQ